MFVSGPGYGDDTPQRRGGGGGSVVSGRDRLRSPDSWDGVDADITRRDADRVAVERRRLREAREAAEVAMRSATAGMR
jgi:hypothetical protein